MSEVPSTETEGRQDRKTSPGLAGEAGIEPATRGFGDRRSTTELHPYEMVLAEGIEPSSTTVYNRAIHPGRYASMIGANAVS